MFDMVPYWQRMADYVLRVNDRPGEWTAKVDEWGKRTLEARYLLSIEEWYLYLQYVKDLQSV